MLAIVANSFARAGKSQRSGNNRGLKRWPPQATVLKIAQSSDPEKPDGWAPSRGAEGQNPHATQDPGQEAGQKGRSRCDQDSARAMGYAGKFCAGRLHGLAAGIHSPNGAGSLSFPAESRTASRVNRQTDRAPTSF